MNKEEWRAKRAAWVLAAVALLLVGVAMAVFLLQRGGSRTSDPPAAESARSVVLTYLDALQRRDRDAIMRLAPPGYAASGDVDQRLSRYAGVRSDTAQVSVTADISPDVVTAVITCLDAGGGRLQWTENIVWTGAWHLLIGARPGASRGSSSTNRS